MPKGESWRLLGACAQLISKVFVPLLKSMTKGWGLLNDSSQGTQMKNDFICTLDCFANALTG